MSMTPVELCKCLADEGRLALVALLWRRGELCVCDLVSMTAMSQPTVSRQLSQLRACGLVSVRRDARWAYYQIADDLPVWAEDVLASLLPMTAAGAQASRPAASCRS